MGRLIDVAGVTDLADGEMRSVLADDKTLVLARVDGQFFAADGRCPHMGGRLAEGLLKGTVVVCPRHGSRFDLRDGRVVQWTSATGLALVLVKAARAPRRLRVYPTTVRDGRVLVDLEAVADQ